MNSSSSSSSSSSDSSDEDVEMFRFTRGKRFEYRLYLNFYSEEDTIKRFRFSKHAIQWLATTLQNLLEPMNNRGCPLSTTQQILITLRYYATGSFQSVNGEFTGIHQSTTRRIIHKVSRAIASLAKQYIKMPTTEEHKNRTKMTFSRINGLPNCIGTIGCTHIPIKSPGGNNSELYRNRKGYFSINTQAICDARCRIMEMTARWFGSTHDQTIFNFSTIKYRLENGEFGDSYLIGDGGYASKSYLLTPFQQPASGPQSRYNKALKTTKAKIEACFRFWKRRFPVLAIESQINVENHLTIIIATAVLHNIAIDLKEGLPPLDPDVNTQEIIVPTQAVIQFEQSNNEFQRNTIINSFFS